MKKNLTSMVLGLWIALTSLAAFIGGWVALSQTSKSGTVVSSSSQPASVQNIQPGVLPTLAPLPGNNAASAPSLQNQRQQPSMQFQFTQPRVRTRSS